MPQGETYWNPYRMVPMREPINRQAPTPHHRFTGISGRLHCRLENLTPLFVARGNTGEPRPFMECNGKPVIPGSSLKGMLRSLAEIVGGGCCVTDTGRGECHANFRACAHANELCIACRMFGMMERGQGARVHTGKVGIGDGLLQDDSLERKVFEVLLSGPKTTHQSFYRNPASGNADGKCRKMYFHQPRVNDQFPTVPQSVQDRAWRVNALTAWHNFDFDVTFSELSGAELSLLLYVIALEDEARVELETDGIRLSGPMRHKLGNAKPYGMGSCKITISRLEYLADPAQRFSTMSGETSRVFEGDLLNSEIAERTDAHRRDNSPTMTQLRKMMVYDEQDTRTFRYPDYYWFKTPANSGTPLKPI